MSHFAVGLTWCILGITAVAVFLVLYTLLAVGITFATLPTAFVLLIMFVYFIGWLINKSKKVKNRFDRRNNPQ